MSQPMQKPTGLFRRSIRLPLLLRLEHILQSISRSSVNPSQLFLLLLTHQLLFVCRGDVRIRGTTCQIPSASLSHIHIQYHPSIHNQREKKKHTPSSMMRRLLDSQRRCLDVLTLARNLRALRVVVYHISRSAAAGGVDVLFDGGGHEVFL